MIPRRTPLRANTGLRRGKPLGRATPLRPVAGLAPGQPMQRTAAPAGRHRTGSRPLRDTGPDPKTRALVLVRDGYQCVRCGCPAGPEIGQYSLQHRKARGVGGDNSLPNLILLCGSATTGCHGAVEARKDPHDLAAGYRLESWQDPAAEGVMYASEHGSGVTLWLDADGGLSPEPPGRAA